MSNTNTCKAKEMVWSSDLGGGSFSVTVLRSAVCRIDAGGMDSDMFLARSNATPDSGTFLARSNATLPVEIETLDDLGVPMPEEQQCKLRHH